jgi:hypothetical protein
MKTKRSSKSLPNISPSPARKLPPLGRFMHGKLTAQRAWGSGRRGRAASNLYFALALGEIRRERERGESAATTGESGPGSR